MMYSASHSAVQLPQWAMQGVGGGGSVQLPSPLVQEAISEFAATHSRPHQLAELLTLNAFVQFSLHANQLPSQSVQTRHRYGSH